MLLLGLLPTAALAVVPRPSPWTALLQAQRAAQPDSTAPLTPAESAAVLAALAEIRSDSARAVAAARAAADSTLREPVSFAPGSATLSDSAVALLERKLWYLWRNPTLRVRLTGHGDSAAQGTAGTSLARRRAIAVRGYFAARGIDLGRIDVGTPASSEGGGTVEFTAEGALLVVDIPAPSTRPPPPIVQHRLTGTTTTVAPWAMVRVFYATDRRRTGATSPEDFYGPDRSRLGQLDVGAVDVSIPRVHRVGVVERPSWFTLDVETDPARHVMLRRVRPMRDSTFFDSLRVSVARSESKEAFVFIHGFNVTFREAALRAAQLTYDLGFDGAPIVYSWPSKGSVFRYSADREEADWTADHLRSFLEEVVRVVGARRVHLIAHSMGSRALTLALQRMQPAAPDTLFSQLVLTAPDIDSDIFTQQIAPAIRGSAARVTVYVSSRDKALRASRALSTHRRLGAGEGGVVVADGLDTIDASRVDTDLLGHGYFASNRAVLDDLFALLRNKLGPDRRNLRRTTDGARVYWIIP